VKKVGPGIQKLSDRSQKMVFIGYEEGTKGYRMFEPESRSLHISRDVIFEEDQAWDWTSSTTDTNQPDQFVIQFPITVADPTTGDPTKNLAPDSPSGSLIAPTQSPGNTQGSTFVHTPEAIPADPNPQWVTRPHGQAEDSEGVPLRYKTLTDLFDHTDEVENYEYNGTCFLAADEPVSVEDALEQSCWKDAMQSELKAIRDNDTWSLSELPKGARAIGLKWVFKVKKDAAGKIVKHKARLVEKGFAQKQGVDYD
jgi:hypothetical protein